MKPVLLLLASLALGAAEYAPAPSEQPKLYTWTTTQSARWRSAGEELRYDTAITWDLALRCTAVDGPRLTLNATFLQVSARHRGPGTDLLVDSASGAGKDDPLLGHLHALHGATLVLSVERATGRVTGVTGGDAVIAAINRRAPAPIAGDPPPLDAQARAAYGPEALAAQWSRILALPRQGPVDASEALPAPFTSGRMVRAWNELAWTVAQPEGAPPAFELARDPSPVRGTVQKLTGAGATVLAADGLPARITGKLAFTLVIEAMTQPVESEHEVAWTLEAK